MRVILLVKYHGIGGTQTVASTLHDGLASRGFEVETFPLYPSTTASTWQKIKGLVAAARQVIRGRYDAAITFDVSASVFVAGFAVVTPRLRRIVLQTVLPSEVRPIWCALDRTAGRLGLYSANVVNSDATKQAFAAYPPSYRRRLVLIPHAVAELEPSLTGLRRGRALAFLTIGQSPSTSAGWRSKKTSVS